MGEISLHKGSLYHVDSALTNTKEPLKERFKPVNNTMLLGRSVSSAEAGHRRHQLVNVCASGFDLTITEGNLHESAGLFFLQLFFLDNLNQLPLFSLSNIQVPFLHDIRDIVNSRNEGFNQSFLAAQFRASGQSGSVCSR